MNNLNFKQVVKDRLFYDRWHYCMKVHLPELSALRQLDHEYIDNVLRSRKYYRSTRPDLALFANWQEITPRVERNLHTFADQFINAQYSYKFVTSSNQGWIYTNDIEFLEELSDNNALEHIQYTQATVLIPRGTIKVASSKHQYRTYFKRIKFSAIEKQQFEQFLRNQSELIRLSPGLLRWFTKPWQTTSDQFFIDYSDEQWLLMLSLVKPNLIRKTLTIITS